VTITRSEALRRANSVWPMGGVPYSQSTIHQPDGYRADCSGYVSMCWAIPLNAPGSWGGMNTVSLVTDGWMHEINPNDLRPGDAIGRCGPGTAGDDGHVQLFTRWLNTDPNDSRYYCLEQTGGTRGPHETLHNWPAGYRAYRYRDISDSAQPEGNMSDWGGLNQPKNFPYPADVASADVATVLRLGDRTGWSDTDGAGWFVTKKLRSIESQSQSNGGGLTALSGKLDALAAKVDHIAVDGIDVDALAGKVADKLAERLSNG
jgi:hypothetical protein